MSFVHIRLALSLVQPLSSWNFSQELVLSISRLPASEPSVPERLQIMSHEVHRVFGPILVHPIQVVEFPGSFGDEVGQQQSTLLIGSHLLFYFKDPAVNYDLKKIIGEF